MPDFQAIWVSGDVVAFQLAVDGQVELRSQHGSNYVAVFVRMEGQ